MLFAGLTIAFAWCRPPGELRAQEMILQVELDAFSGRPNPRWDLTQTQAAEFLARLRKLQQAQSSFPRSDGLGYRGFIVSGNEGMLDSYNDARVYRGIVFARRGKREEIFADSERSLERWLLESARGHVDESALKYIESEIAR